MNEIRLNAAGIETLTNSREMVNELGRIAEDLAGTVNAPADMTIATRKGHSRRGAFAQVQMLGDGAVAVEFGSRNNPPLAPLRSALARFKAL